MTSQDPAAPGTRYGRRVIIGPASSSKRGARRVMVRCECGREHRVDLRGLRCGIGHSCRHCASADKADGSRGYERPRQLAVDLSRECLNPGGERPCTRSDCAMWLAHPEQSCALDVAAEGPHGLREIGELLGCTGEAVRMVEANALAKLRRMVAVRIVRNAGFEDCGDDSSLTWQAMTPKLGAA